MKRSTSEITLLLRWRIASAITHGRRETLWMVTDASIDELIPGGFLATMSANVDYTADAIEAAIGWMDDAIQLFRRRSAGGV